MAIGEQDTSAGSVTRLAPQRYTRVAIALHWLVALAVFGQIGLGWFLDTVPRGTPDRTVWVNLHKSTGLVLGVLVLIRLLWRLTHRPPPLPLAMPRWERVAASANHALLYVCLIGMPLAGYIASNHSRFGIRFFGIPLAPWGTDDRALYALFNGIHGALSWLLVALIALHLAATAKHVFIDRDAILQRMWRG